MGAAGGDRGEPLAAHRIAPTMTDSEPYSARFRQLDVDRHLDVVTDDDSARFECDVPVEAVFLAIDLRGRAEASAVVTPGIATATFAARLENRRMSRPANGEITVDLELSVEVARHPIALERELRVSSRVEEIRRAEMVVTLILARIDLSRCRSCTSMPTLRQCHRSLPIQ